MKTAAVLTAITIAASVAVGAAFADGLPAVPTVPPAPSIPTPPVAVPVTIPKVSVPTLPVSTPKTSTHVATPAAVSHSVPSISVSSGGVDVGTSSSGASAGTEPSGGSSSDSYGTASGSSARSGPPIARLRSSRAWLAQHGPANRRRTILNFRLPAASRVIFSVTQVSPVCRAAGHFAVTGEQGLNRVVFRGRVNGRDLAPGTYKITARVPGHGTILHVVVVVVDAGVPSPSDLAFARKSDVCSAASRGLAVSSAGAVANGSGTRGEAAPTSSGDSGGAAGSGGASSGPTSGTAGETFTTHSAVPFSPERVSRNVRNPLVIFALAAAILLLGLAALPKTAIPDPRMTDVLVRHRVEVALAGAAALTAALIALALA